MAVKGLNTKVTAIWFYVAMVFLSERDCDFLRNL